MRVRHILSALLTVSVLALSANANVSLRNGNFFIGYKDILFPGGFEPKIERVYNSKSGYYGMFGHGWGTEYEVKLKIAADGSIVVHEYGGGAENRFLNKNFSRNNLKKAVEKIVQAAKKTGMLTTDKMVANYRKQLLNDAIFRNDEWDKFVRAKILKPSPVKAGTKFFSNRFSFQYVQKQKKGWKRVFDNGRIELFDDIGRLIRITDKNSNFIKFEYGKDGKLAKLEDNQFRKMYFKFNRRGLLEQVSDDQNRKANYRYNDQNELVWSRDIAGNVFTYKYSKDKRHNMTEIGYSDKTSMKIAYYDKSQNENVRSIVDRDGTRTDYSYKINKKDANNFAVNVSVKNKQGKEISKSSYEYFMKIKATGEKWTYRMVSNIDGDRTETTYNECCGYPIEIKRGNQKTAFKYNKKGQVVKKDTPTEVVNLDYHKRHGKVTKVQRYSKITKRKRWSEFAYDSKGNLKKARNSDKKGVTLVYDRYGRIAQMVDQQKRQIKFKYNENSKPIEITDPKLGTIRVTYTNTGEVKKVESTAGRKIALQVTSAFQNLLDIIRPAGVTLSF